MGESSPGENPIEKRIQATLEKRVTRRNFLELAGKATLVGGGITLGLTGDEKRVPIPKEISKDILSEKDLKEARIKIYQTPDIQLRLRQSALEFPLFKHASKGKFDEVVIVLVDHFVIPYNGNKIVPREAQLVWRADYHPDKIGIILDKERSNLKESLKFWQHSERFWQHSSDKTNDTNKQKEYQRKVNEAQQKQKALTTELDKVGSEEWFNNRGMGGKFLSGKMLSQSNPEFLRKYPKFANKVFIFLAVGGEFRPEPSQSLPPPENLPKGGEEWGYRYLPSSKFPGFALRHEIFHYDPSGQRDFTPEDEADILAFNSLTDAWKKFREEGDISGYSFVFVTNKGVTLTRTAPTKRPDTSPKETV